MDPNEEWGADYELLQQIPGIDEVHVQKVDYLPKTGKFTLKPLLITLRLNNKKPLKNQGFQMRKMGLEPTQLESYKILSLARLPVPTLPHVPALVFCCPARHK